LHASGLTTRKNQVFQNIGFEGKDFWDRALVQQGRNNAPVFKSIKPLFFSGSANYKPGHYFCLDVLGHTWDVYSCITRN